MFRPSQAHIVLSCPGAEQWIEKAGEQPSSAYAEEGQRAHEVVNRMILGKPYDDLNPDYDMIDGAEQVLTLLSALQEQAQLDGHKVSGPWTEIETSGLRKYGVKNGICDGFIICGPTLHILDYKYGRGIPVSPVENKQLGTYGLDFKNTFAPYGIERVVFWIIQPRICERPLQWDATEWLVSFEHLLLNRVKEGYASGEHCRFCPIRGRCPIQAAEIESLFEISLGKEILDLPDIALLTAEELAKYLDHADTLSRWMTALRHAAKERAEYGEEIPGYELVASKGNRAWIDEEEAVEKFKHIGDDIYTKSFKSPAQLEKILKHKKLKKELEMLANSTHRPTGANQLKKKQESVNYDLFSSFTD